MCIHLKICMCMYDMVCTIHLYCNSRNDHKTLHGCIIGWTIALSLNNTNETCWPDLLTTSLSSMHIIHNITLFHNKYRTHQYMSIGMNRALLIHGISKFRNGCVWQHIHFHWLTVPVNWHVTTLCGSRKARLWWAFLLWHTNEGYPAQACPRQHIDASYLGANTLATAV